MTQSAVILAGAGMAFDDVCDEVEKGMKRRIIKKQAGEVELCHQANCQALG